MAESNYECMYHVEENPVRLHIYGMTGFTRMNIGQHRRREAPFPGFGQKRNISASVNNGLCSVRFVFTQRL